MSKTYKDKKYRSDKREMEDSLKKSSRRRDRYVEKQELEEIKRGYNRKEE